MNTPPTFVEWMPKTLNINKDISLHRINIEDAELVFNLIQENKEHLAQWLGWVYATETVEHTKRFLEHCQDLFENGEGVTYLIVYCGKTAGLVELHHVDLLNGNGKFGYWLAKSYTGRGLMVQSCKILIQYVFGVLGWNHLGIHCATENYASQSVALKLGFIYSHQISKAENLYGTWVDHKVYQLKNKMLV